MNGNTYVVPNESLVRITGENKGSIIPFFTRETAEELNEAGENSSNVEGSPVVTNVTFVPLNGLVTFTDVPADAYYADAVSWAVAEGVTSGTSNSTFSPDNDCTRAQIVTFLWRLFG